MNAALPTGPGLLLLAAAILLAGCAHRSPAAAGPGAGTPTPAHARAADTVAAHLPGDIAFHHGISGTPLETVAVATRIAQARVIHVGELHGTPEIHRLQAAIAQALLDAGHPVVIAVEMLPWTLQGYADAWASGALDAEAFRDAIDWPRIWGHAWDAYAPLFEVAQHPGASLLALNAPPGLSRDVFRNGLESLPPEARVLLPADMFPDPLPAPAGSLREPADVATRDETDAYRQAVLGALAAHGHLPEDPAARRTIEERFFQAQLVWDETMAAVLAGAVESLPPHTRFVVAMGAMHVAGGGGVPDRLARRVSVSQVRVVCLPSAPDPAAPAGLVRTTADDIACVVVHADPEPGTNAEQ